MGSRRPWLLAFAFAFAFAFATQVLAARTAHAQYCAIGGSGYLTRTDLSLPNRAPEQRSLAICADHVDKQASRVTVRVHLGWSNTQDFWLEFDPDRLRVPQLLGTGGASLTVGPSFPASSGTITVVTRAPDRVDVNFVAEVQVAGRTFYMRGGLAFRLSQ